MSLQVGSTELVVSTGALLEGHFVLESGLHSGHFVSKDMVGTQPHKLRKVAVSIAFHFSEVFSGVCVEVVAAPAVGAIALASRVAEELGENVRSIFAEKEGGRFVFTRGYDQFIRLGTRVLVIEDIVTTGKTTRGIMEAVQKLGGKVVGVGLLWNRSTGEFDVPVFSFVTKTFPNYAAEECPLCRGRVPINTTANKHGQEFLDEHGENPDDWPANQK